MKDKKKMFIIGGTVLLILVITLVIIFYPRKGDVLETEKSLISIQSSKEENFEIEGYTYENPNIILNPYGNSPLTALIIFETEEKVTPILTIKGKDTNTTYEQTFEEGENHYLPVLGLYAGTENEVIIKIGEEEKTFIIKTEELPEDFSLPEKVYSDKSKLSNELYFYTPSAQGYTSAYDINGDVRWYLTTKNTWKISRLENGNYLLGTERIINSPYYTTGLYEMDMLGKIYNEYSLEGGYHHDFFELENGNILALSNDFANNTVEDYIVEIEKDTGKIVKEIDLKNILNTEDGKSENWIDYDWFHANSIWYDDVNDSIILSGRHQDAVISVDYKSEELNWIIGDPTNWSEEYQKYFFTPIGDSQFEWQWSQHSAMTTPEGYIMILDNGNNKSKIEEEYVPATESYTRGVMYKIDTENMTIEQVWQYGKERGSSFYSPYVSDVDYIDENHYIVNSGGIVYVDGEVVNSPAGLANSDKLETQTVELLNDKIIFEMVLPTNTYKVEKSTLYDNYEFNLGVAKSFGTLGETKVDETKFNPLLNTSDIDDEYESRDFEISKEVDRLSIEGNFQRGDDVNIILSKNGVNSYYNLNVSTRPYTALCVDIFVDIDSENGIRGYKYINEEGLEGNYNIYIELNGKIYDTLSKVVFKN